MKFTYHLVHRICAAFVFCASCTVYLLTMAPSICFWDCGEFLAASASLGIPHPPGTPLLIMMGRVAVILLSFVHDVGRRLNLFSIFGSAVTVMFVYLIIVQALKMFLGAPDTLWKKVTYCCSGVVGALFAAYGNTFWFCSLEASEQCNICLIPVVLTIWLALIWAQSADPRRDRLLLLIAYLGYVGVGMHMISMITMPVIFLFVMLVDRAKRYDWRLWMAGLLLSTVMYNLSWFMIVCPTLVVVALVMMLLSRKQAPRWRFVFWFSLLALVGFTDHLFMPIRSSLNPTIDENHPVTWDALTQALDRKQYGSESMVSRSFWRRGSLGHQFGIEGHMGYGGFHLTQFFHFSPQDTKQSFLEHGGLAGAAKLLIYLLPTAFMLFGWYYFYRRRRNVAVLLIGITILTTVVLTWYMNFSDGTRAEKHDYLSWVNAGKPGPLPVVYREVRVRDYFWNIGFMFFGMWIGLSAAAALHLLFTHKTSFYRRTLAPIAIVLFAASPALPLTQNWKERYRGDNWLPFDFAYNLLMSCDKDALLFTNGDNDTFPLWAIQEGYGVRRDVRLINLSLANTDWYIKQLKYVEPKVPISYTDNQIDALNAQINPFTAPTPYEMPKAGITVVLPDQKTHNALRVQDKLVLNVVESDHWTKPIYFASTASDDNFMGLDPYLQMQGLVYRLLPKPVPQDQRLDIERSEYLLNKVYHFRALGDRAAPLDETSRQLVTNYAACYIQTALQLRTRCLSIKSSIDALDSLKSRPPVSDSALVVLRAEYEDKLAATVKNFDECVSLLPDEPRWRGMRHQVLMDFGLYQKAEDRARQALALDPENADYRTMLAQALSKNGKESEAQKLWNEGPAFNAGHRLSGRRRAPDN